MRPSDRLYLHYECTNRDCTGNGFYLTRALQKALESRSCIEGEMWCDGKEDWEYIKSSGCSCMTCLKYKIEPQFEDAQYMVFEKRSSPLSSTRALSSEGLCCSYMALLRQVTSALLPTAPTRLCIWDLHRLARLVAHMALAQ